MTENKNDLREMTINFALSVSDVCDNINGCQAYTNQIIRSSSSIGANLFEAKYAQSRADFIHKLEISLKSVPKQNTGLICFTERQSFQMSNTYSSIQSEGRFIES